jgi:hypothetical protein
MKTYLYSNKDEINVSTSQIKHIYMGSPGTRLCDLFSGQAIM